MSNRVQKTNYEKKDLVLKEFITGEVVEVKESETIEPGQVLIFSSTEKKYVKYDKSTHSSNFSNEIVRIRLYIGEEEITTNSTNNKVVVLRQGVLNKAKVKGLEEEDYNLLAQLELQNIYLEDVK